ncbi:MAG: Gldg family protein, partial [Clostridiales bacterium]|nr:Gldg family protein [Clostridiales bacterium]
MNEQKKQNKKALRIGSFSIIISVVVLAIVIAANLLVSSLPGWIIRPDTTAEGMFTISDATREIVDALETDITLYHVTQPENADPTVQEILQRYADLSSHIKVMEIDPVEQPTFLSQYTTSDLAENSIIAVSDKRSTVIDGNNLYMYMLAGDDLNYYTQTEYENINSAYLTYYGQYVSATEYFFGENELTRAIDYVATDELPVLYVVGGHGEIEFTETFTSAVADENVELRELTLLSGEEQGVPEDAAAILLYVPQMDITAEELDVLKAYLDGGGNILLFTLYQYCTADTMPNLAALTEYMGLAATGDMIMEGDSARYYQVPYMIIPTLTEQGLCANLSSTNITTLMFAAHPITNTESNENVTAVPLMTTSDAAYLSADEEQTASSFTIAWEATLNEGGKLIWFGSLSVLDEGYLNMHSSLLAAMLQEVCDKPTA